MRIAMLGLKGLPKAHSGVERQVVEIGRRLVERGHEVTAFCRPHYTDVCGDYMGMKIRLLPSFNTKHLDAFSHTALGTLACLFSGYDVVHYHAIGPSLFSWMPRVTGAGTVVTVHGLDWQRAKWNALASRVLRVGEWTSARLPDRTIVVSRSLKDYYEKKYGGAVSYVPNGIAVPEPAAPGRITESWGLGGGDYILFAGRLVPEKGCHLLIEAFKRLRTDKRLVIAGSSSHTDRYSSGLRKAAAGDGRITFTGHVTGETLAELYSNCYLYVLPSLVEGLSVALLEALSYGKAALVSDIDANLEIIEAAAGPSGGSPHAGFSFRSGDADDLGHKLEALLDEPALVECCGRTAREHVSARYDWDAAAAQTEAVYREACTRDGLLRKA